MKATALVVAAGSGERLGASRPKAFVFVAGRPMLDWSLLALADVHEVGEWVIAVPPSVKERGPSPFLQPLRAQALQERGRTPFLQVLPPCVHSGADVRAVPGGSTRSESVRNALAVVPAEVERVVVHDAARPLAPAELFSRTLAALDDADAAIAAVRVTDTVKRSSDGRTVEETLDRSRLWAVQTPQAFRAAALRAALDQPADVLATATDDAMLVERAGGRVVLVESSPANLKITTPHDLRVAEQLLRERAP